WDEVCANGHSMRDAKWFRGASLNFAENLLRFKDTKPAIVFVSERGQRESISYAQLCDEVSKVASYLKSLGVGVGDKVAAYLPNIPQTVIAMLATASLGAVWSSCSPDFGLRAVRDRFSQIDPKILFTADGYFYNGKFCDTLQTASQLAKEITSIEHTIVIPYASPTPDISMVRDSLQWAEIQSKSPGEIEFVHLPFDHPLYILYSSGTTGAPKCIVHGAGGTLIQHLKELVLHCDLKRSDKIMYYTTCGWMMWNWLVSSLAVGATVLLYDGSPFYPDGKALFDVAEREKLSVFGTSAKYISAVEKAAVRPIESHDLSALRLILSTGSPLLPENFSFVYSSIKRDIHLASISGGTDIVSCFALGNPITPVYSGELQTRGLGMSVEVFNEDGESVIQECGELVCTRPFPSMPIYFLNDPEGEKYHNAYFNVFDGVWRHGDWAEITAHDGVIIYGRSDAVLNPGGVRIGTAEIYQEVEQFLEILECMAVGQEWEGSERVILFVKLRPDLVLSDDLRESLKAQIRKNTTPRHVPAKIIQVSDLPKTFNGKIAELAVKNVMHGRAVKNLDALSNPEALEVFRNLEALRT
ncbi:MAG: acetoacetate--CoA ligase, partial [Deltaproteobacteria bacterium]|nr:acetoacetate--CoA ligase [Deltaproteobacteria bacterium]